MRFVGADVAIADGRYDSVGRADGTDQRMLTSMVLRREGGAWKIAAIRNMLPSDAAALIRPFAFRRTRRPSIAADAP